jgi:hypothetical protein
MTENCKFRKAILSAFYNISRRSFGILLILWCSFKLWWNFCLDQNFSYKGKGPFRVEMSGKIHVFDVLYNLRNSARFHSQNAWNRNSGTLDFKIFPGMHVVLPKKLRSGYATDSTAHIFRFAFFPVLPPPPPVKIS